MFFSECVYCTLLCVVLRTLFPLQIGAIWKEVGKTVKEMDFFINSPENYFKFHSKVNYYKLT